MDPAPAKEFSSPEAGMRFVAVQFRLQNTGTAPYSDSPSNGAKVIDTQGQQFESTISDTGAGPSFTGTTTIAPGATALGFITFQVPSTSRLAQVQFALDSGFAKDVGQWNLP
ncbi:hypothetical protein GCM10010440_70990 [Kitasatospora cinereorecta]